MDWIAELSFRGWDEPRVLSRCTLAKKCKVPPRDIVATGEGGSAIELRPAYKKKSSLVLFAPLLF